MSVNRFHSVGSNVLAQAQNLICILGREPIKPPIHTDESSESSSREDHLGPKLVEQQNVYIEFLMLNIHRLNRA